MAASRIVAPRPSSCRQREEADVRERVVDPRTAERADDDDAGRAESDRRKHRQLGVRFVLVRTGPFERDPGGFEGGEVRRIDRIAVADPQVDRHAEDRRVAGAAVGRDDDADPGIPSRPGEVEPRPFGPGAVGEDEGVHLADATPRPIPPARRM